MKEAIVKVDTSMESVQSKQESIAQLIDETRSLLTSIDDNSKRENENCSKTLAKLKAKCLREIEQNIKLIPTSRMKSTTGRNIFT